MTALFIVRAEVATEDRAAFDRWYEAEHLPDAMAAFGTARARRGWSETDPGIHVAVYEFGTLEEARAIAGGDASDTIRALIAEFDRVWPTVQRTREIVGIRQVLDAND